MRLEEDVPHEPLRWAEVPGWFLFLWPRLKDRLHRSVHRRLARDHEECPHCAGWRNDAHRHLEDADQRADEVRRLERLLAAEQAKRGVVPGMPVTDAEFAVATDTLLAGQKPRLPQPDINQLVQNMIGPPKAVAPEPPAEPPGLLTYEDVIKFQKPKGEPVISESMLDAARALASPPAVSWGRVKLPLADLVLTKGETRVQQLDAARKAEA